MPNHCENRTTIWGSPSQVAEVIKAMIDESETGFAISNLVPMPKGLKDSTASFVTAEIPTRWAELVTEGEWTQEEYDEAVARNNEAWAAKKARIDEFGYGDWYEWACANENWGTKWGDYSHSGDFPNLVDLESSTKDKIEVVFDYDTAWSPFSPQFWEQVSARFPEVRFDTRYQEPGICFAGVTAAYKGVAVDECTNDLPEVDWDTDDSGEVWHEMMDALLDRLYDIADLKLAFSSLAEA